MNTNGDLKQDNSLIKLDAFTQALAEASTIPEVKNLADQADLFRQWLRKQRVGWQALNAGLEMKLRAERKLGDILKPNHIERSNGGYSFHGGMSTTPYQEALKESRIPPTNSFRWQRLSQIPEEHLIRYITELGDKEELSTAGFLRFHLNILREGVEIPPLPKDLFTIIYADPPWDYEHFVDSKRSIIDNYDTMTIEQLCQLKMPAGNDAILFLWATNPKLDEALQVINAWGFQYRTNMVWVKDKIGMGYYVRSQHELLLIARKGNLAPPDESLRVSSVITAPRTNHSRKPEEIYSVIERMYPNQKYIELFARIKRPNWTSWGKAIEGNS